ncbi:MAG: methyltransferase domain-containing protein [Chthoniobacteraceae bacterium]
MVALARRAAPVVADRLGYANVKFCQGHIQDLALDLEALDAELRAHPISSADAYLAVESLAASLRVKQPLVAGDSVDAVISNCALNLVESVSKQSVFQEMFRVLKKGGPGDSFGSGER